MAKKVILEKGKIIDYQTVIEENVGDFVASNVDCYRLYDDLTEEQKDETGRSLDAKERGWFVPDADYELIIRKKRG